MTKTNTRQYHLLVLVHGLWGTIGHFDYICTELADSGAVILDDDVENAEESSGLVVYRTESNQGYFTYDGIDVCGTRVANEVCSVIDKLESKGQVATISIMGYSLGGLLSRYAIGVLYKRGILHRIKPRAFTTFCTPHVGVVVLGNRLSTRAFNQVGSMSMASTSKQLFLRDKFKNGKPLLQCMVENDSAFKIGLEMFDYRCLYANIAYDARCEWYTAGISTLDPYAGRAHLLEGPYIDGYKPSILDASDPPKFQWNRHSTNQRNFWQVIEFYFIAFIKILVVIPLWFVAFVINASYQNVTSSFRQYMFRKQGLHEPIVDSSSKASSRRSSFIAPEDHGLDEFLEEGANDVVESMYRAINEDEKHEEGVALQLDSTQLKIINGLNALNWDKYPVIIRNHHHAHAAVIVRYKNANFDEGRLIVKHWVDRLAELLE